MIWNTVIIIITIIVVDSLNFRVNKNRDYCFEIPGNNTYEFQYIVSGEGQNNVQCTISDSHKSIQTVSYISQFETTFTVQGNKGKICFSALDNHPKIVSFDFISIYSKNNKKTTEIQRNSIQSNLLKAYQLMEKLYRNQHFYLERSRIHHQLLDDVQLKLTLMIGWKIILVILCGTIQLFVIKKIIDRKGSTYIPLNSY